MLEPKRDASQTPFGSLPTIMPVLSRGAAMDGALRERLRALVVHPLPARKQRSRGSLGSETRRWSSRGRWQTYCTLSQVRPVTCSLVIATKANAIVSGTCTTVESVAGSELDASPLDGMEPSVAGRDCDRAVTSKSDLGTGNFHRCNDNCSTDVRGAT
jgi:hypothetical protein